MATLVAGTAYRERTREDAKLALHDELMKLAAKCPPEQREHFMKEMFAFENLFSRYIEEATTTIDWDKIKPPPAEVLRPYKSLGSVDLPPKDLLNKLVVVKLNGGLGTTMGCVGPKSVIRVRDEFTFLDLVVQQIYHLNQNYGCDVPLVLMNSFNTHDDTHKLLRKYTPLISVESFNQSRYPRLNRETLHPLPENYEVDPKSLESWYPPGHGDLYESLYNSGLVDKLLAQGREYLFVSNIDNLGAVVDLPIMNYLVHSLSSPQPVEFVMEVTQKTRADVKGGTLIDYNGQLRLLEIAQVPRDHVDDFQSVRKFRIFNTNNLWIRLSALKRVVESRKLSMEIIVNPKTLDNGTNVIQLETAVGAAIQNFNGSIGVDVPRSRFLPVKTTSDLLLMMSNLYRLHEGRLEMDPRRGFESTPIVKLGPEFKKVKDFLARFQTIPDLLELDHLTVSGNVTFGKRVSLKGTVIIIANHGDRIDIANCSELENKIVTGNCRIQDH